MKTPVQTAPCAEILFFDLAEIESLQDLALSVCEARKHPVNPVMEHRPFLNVQAEKERM